MDQVSMLLACSGEGSSLVIRESILIGEFCAAIGGVVTAALLWDGLHTRIWRYPPFIALAMFLVHPAWTISAISGDCGYAKRHASYLLTGIFVALAIVQFVLSHRRMTERTN